MTQSTATNSDDEDEQRREHGSDETTAVVIDPLEGLIESERLALLIRFGAAGSKGGMCAAMSHGHSFQSSIFRLPAKCAGCHELVWGPFTRGCTCLACSVTVHRSCTGVATMPRCPTKHVFDAFCRSELGLPPLPASPAASAGAATGSPSSSAAGSSEEDGAKAAGETLSAETTGGSGGVLEESATAGGDLEEWAKVEEASGHSIPPPAADAVVPSPHQQHQQPPASASCAVQDLGSSFSWSPLGLGERKRPISEDTTEGRGLANTSREAGDAAGSSSPRTTAPESQEASGTTPAAAATADLAVTAASAAASPATRSNVGIRGVTKMSVAGGVVGALFGGPVGAVVGLKLGAVLGAGRSVQQGLWQRIEKNRREAGADGIGLPKDADAAATVPAAANLAEEEAARRPRDLWARIAQQVEGEQQPAIWYVLFLPILGVNISPPRFYQSSTRRELCRYLARVACQVFPPLYYCTVRADRGHDFSDAGQEANQTCL